MEEQGKAGEDDALDMILHIDVYDGCLSGDCPHDHANECLESVSKYAKEYCPDAREQYLALLALSDASSTLRQRLAVVDAELSALRASHERMRGAIERALADSESGNGWGPDVTVCSYLREAISPPAPGGGGA